MKSQSTSSLETETQQDQEEEDNVIVTQDLPSSTQPYSCYYHIPLEMERDLQQHRCDFSWRQQQLPPTSNTIIESSSSTTEQAKSMNADLYRCLQAGKIDALNDTLEDSLLEQVTPQLNTASHIVSRHGFVQLIEPILRRRPHLLTQQNLNGDLALHLAAGAGHFATVESIMTFAGQENRVRLCEVGNIDADTALHVAVRHNHIRVARFLIESHPKASFCLNKRGESPLFTAAGLGELELVRTMIQVSDMVDAQSILTEGKSIVHAAILGGNLGVLEAILSKHPFLIDSTAMLPPMEGGIPPLSCAASKGNVEMVRYLLAQFPDCMYKRHLSGIYPIHVAAGAGHKMVLDEFLCLHPDSRELLTLYGCNILHVAVSQGKDDVVSYILSDPDLDELINVSDNNGNTPLHFAVAAKFPKVVDALTWNKRVKLDLENNYGQTAMDVALNLENPVPSLKEQLIWLALKYAGAPKGNLQPAKRTRKAEQATAETYKDRVNTLSVVATLVTTMSFAAGFTMPGGNSGSTEDLGMANFLKRRIFGLFVISNSTALYTSVLNVLVLIFAMLGDANLLRISLKVAVPLLATSLVTMSISFMSAAYLVVSSLKWLRIVIWVIGSLSFLLHYWHSFSFCSPLYLPKISMLVTLPTHLSE